MSDIDQIIAERDELRSEVRTLTTARRIIVAERDELRRDAKTNQKHAAMYKARVAELEKELEISREASALAIERMDIADEKWEKAEARVAELEGFLRNLVANPGMSGLFIEDAGELLDGKEVEGE